MNHAIEIFKTAANQLDTLIKCESFQPGKIVEYGLKRGRHYLHVTDANSITLKISIWLELPKP